MRAILCTLWVSLCTPVLAPAAFAQSAEVVSTVSVEVALVRATRGAPAVDPKLKAMAKALTSLPYQHFEAVGTERWSSKPGKKGQATLPGDVRVEATVTGVSDRGVSVSVSVFRGDKRVANTTFERPWGLAHVLGIGKDGDAAMLVPIRVTR